MRTTARKAAGAGAAMALAAATLVTGAGAASAAPAEAAATCGTSGLRASLADKSPGGQSGMSHEGTVLTLTNTSDHTCALRGYPGLGLEDARHGPLETHTSWGSTYFIPDPGKQTLRLRPGESAEAGLAWAHADAPTMVQARYLEITPPASRDHLTVPFDKTVTNGDLSVTAFARTVDVP
ncbi:hypothetical protein BLA24_05920 [Streptomyces cinnamoneus]|uniref:DUF4232 domain-containing protein n=1 Tax=Streptomyces cinnamoneus TaxID=53446 RepID=A0A2G1XNK5_STRCJ|nr:DUF4232 domain-containing protein [Streptomyces cinnamoneus]PHQ52796.1 hypothetical protein BLA24_05920 [Streptomyces cinnamoneus]PPT11898.1 DUF4232 domain-containing protein [Streptomyces cinnamoneus]